MQEKDAATVLEDAADLLLIHGRCVGNLENGAGEMCALGALGKAAHGAARSHEYSTGYIGAYVALTAQVGRPIYAWNNDATTTDDAVRDGLLLAAKSLRNEASA